MKHLTYLLFTIICITNFDLNGQVLNGSFNAGSNFSTFEYGDQINTAGEFDNTRKAGLNIGGNINIDLGSEYVTFMPGLFFQQNGSKEYLSDFSILLPGTFDRSINLNYIGMVFPLELAMINEDLSGLMMGISGFLDYAVSGNINRDDSESAIGFNSAFDRVDLGFSFNITYSMPGGYGMAFVYSKGLKNIEFSEAAGYSSTQEDESYLINNNGLTLQFKAIF